MLEVLARAALAGGDPAQLPAAERAASSLVERHPFRESGYVLLMQAQADRGNVAEATLTFDRLRCLLRDELGTVPSPDVSALHDELLQRGRRRAQESLPGPVAAAHADRPAGPVPLPVIGGAAGASAFVGRESYLERLRAPWLEAGTGPAPARAARRRAGRRQDAARVALRRRGARRRRDGALRPLRRGAAARLPALRAGAAPLPAPRRLGSRRRERERPAAARAADARGAPPTRAPSAQRSRTRARTATATCSSRRSAGCWAARRAPGRCCSCSTTCTGPTSRPCCCCATCCA